MFHIKKNIAGQQQVIFDASKIVAITLPTRALCTAWIAEHYPEAVENSYSARVLASTRNAIKRAQEAFKQPVHSKLNSQVNAAVWRARDGL